MKHKALAILAVSAFIALAQGASADEYHRATNDNPLRIARYVLQPVCLVGEYFISRPIHWVVSQDNADIVFGHAANAKHDGNYYAWTHGDGSPSVKVEREAKMAKEQAIQAEKKSTAKPAAAKDAKAEKKAKEAKLAKKEKDAKEAKPKAEKQAKAEGDKAEKKAKEANKNAKEAAPKAEDVK
jgi:type IV secretory pathway VirB10-like protein